MVYSSNLTSLNFSITFQLFVIYGKICCYLCLLIWSTVITSILLLILLPILTSILILVIEDLHYDTIYYDSMFGGDPIFYQHVFWFFGHPEVYILVLPTFGLLSVVLISSINIYIFGNQSMILAMGCICILGSVVWIHHMFTVTLDSDTRAYFTSLTLMISLPTGSKILGWLFTYLLSILIVYICYDICYLYIIVFNELFTLGGNTGILLGNVVIDCGLHDTYFIVSHFHLILSLGTIIILFLTTYLSINIFLYFN